MYKFEVLEAAPIVTAVLNTILEWVPSRGREGSDVRMSVGDIKANIQTLLFNDTLGPPLLNAFEQARLAGMTLPQMENVRVTAAAQIAVSIGAVVARDACIMLALSEEARIIADMIFSSKQDVDKVRVLIQNSFEPIEEEMCDQMDSMTYRRLVALHATMIAYLTERTRPLPQMLNFRFAHSWPTLTMAYKLYADAGRADELRNENKVVHPAFELPWGQALAG